MQSGTFANPHVVVFVPGPYTNRRQPCGLSSRTRRTESDPRVKSQVSRGISVITPQAERENATPGRASRCIRREYERRGTQAATCASTLFRFLSGEHAAEKAVSVPRTTADDQNKKPSGIVSVRFLQERRASYREPSFPRVYRHLAPIGQSLSRDSLFRNCRHYGGERAV